MERKDTEAKKVSFVSKEDLQDYINDYCGEHGWDSDLNHIDVSSVTDMSDLFSGTRFTGDISKWDVSGVKDMSGMFSNCPFNGDISGWDVSGVEDMCHMFSYSGFNRPINDWDTGNVANMECMFKDSLFNQPLDNWDVSRVTNMSGMFQNGKFGQDVSNWDIGSLSMASYMFYNCETRNVPVNWDLSRIEDFDKDNIFTSKVSFDNKEDLRNYIKDYCGEHGWDSDLNHIDTSGITDMSGLFKDLPFEGAIHMWDTSNVTDMSHMFENCPFNNPVGSWDVGNVRNMSHMFANSGFGHSLGDWVTENVTDMSHMFENCSIAMSYFHLFTRNVTDMSYMFAHSGIRADLTFLNVSKVRDMSHMFEGAVSLPNCPGWKLGKGVKTDHMFDSTIFEGKENSMKEQERKYSLPEDKETGMVQEPSAIQLQPGIYTPEAVVSRIKERVKASMKIANVPLSTLTRDIASRMRGLYAKATAKDVPGDLSAECSCKYLFDNALAYASKHDGLWLNAKGGTHPATIPYKQEFTHYGAVLAALYSQERGFATNVFCGMESLGTMKVSIKEKELYHPIEIPMLDTDGSQVKKLFNIEQTTMEKDSPRRWARCNAKYSGSAKPEDLYIHKSFEVYEREKEDPAIRMFRIGEKYLLFGDHALEAGKILGRDTVFNRDIGVLTLSVPISEMEHSVASLSSAARKIALHDSKSLFTVNRPSKLYDTFLPFIKDRAEKFGIRTEPCYHARSYFDKDSGILYLRGVTGTSKPRNDIDKEQEASSILRALADMAQRRIGSHALGLDGLKPEDAEKYSRLLSEISAGSQLLLRNMPARISDENMPLIPYWRQQLRENPGMRQIIENGVNYIHDMMTDLNIRRYSREMSVSGVVAKNPATLTITEDLGGYPDISTRTAVIIRNDKKRYADVLLPSGASPYSLEEISGMEKDTFVAALAKEGIREVNFFNIHGYCAMRYPNMYYDDKKIEIVTMRDGKIVPTAIVDVKDEIRRTSGLQVESMGLLKNFGGRLEMYIVPREGKPVSIEPTYNDVQEYFNAVKMPDKEMGMEKKRELAVKYYNKAMQSPELQTDLLAPRIDGIDTDRIRRIKMVKREDGTSEIHAMIDGKQCKKPLSFDQYQRLWIVTDKDAYKLALSAKIFEKELSREESQSVSLDTGDSKTEERKSVPVEVYDSGIDGDEVTQESDIEQDDKKDVRSAGRRR